MADEIKYLGVEAGQALAEQIKKKQNKLIPGAGISIEGNTISASIDAGTLATKEELNDYAKKADVYNKERYLMDTHTAVAWSVYKKWAKDNENGHKSVVLSTASAYKFSASVMSALGKEYKD